MGPSLYDMLTRLKNGSACARDIYKKISHQHAHPNPHTSNATKPADCTREGNW